VSRKFSVGTYLLEPDQFLSLAVAAEQTGYDSVVLADSVFFPERVSAPYPYTPDGSRMWSAETPWLEPLVAIPAMAAVTTRIRFYTSVLKLPIRSPLLVAKAVGSAAVLSGNRVGLGVGLAWIPEEFEWCQTEYATRGPQLSPAPSEPVPIYVGGHAAPALRRAARLGDGWCSAMITEPELGSAVASLREHREAYGRSELPFEIQVVAPSPLDVDACERLFELGATDLITIPWLLYGGATGSAEAKRRALERYATEVVAKLRS
jgi:alkanesulfonate monooxygenase SsuD/methylene tetrahydromethanopterin reductase-like flavin-dependent oxidoreductase (luciferase family)